MADITSCINTLSDFLGVRDVPELSSVNVRSYFGGKCADVMVLFGGSIMCGGDLLSQAMARGVADKYIIVGGEGHTTQKLRDVIHSHRPDIETDGLPEAVVFDRYISTVCGVHADFLETNSTNCGNNITNLLQLLADNAVCSDRIILCQDCSMQRRMDAGMRKYAPETRILNYSIYKTSVTQGADGIEFTESIPGMWSIPRYIELLMGEIPRLRDDAAGYGPNGKGFIAHVHIPYEVLNAYEVLKNELGIATRYANSAYASSK